MINPGEIPQIPGNMDVLATHAQTVRTTGGDFANTGQAVDSTFQGLAAVYKAPEATQLFAATGPVRTVSASVGEDIQAVGAALATYASEVKEIKAQLAALKGQAEQFVGSVKDDEDWREDEGKVNQHNGLITAVNTQVAAFFEAQRKCANTINALYGGRQYRADNADGQAEDGEYGFTADMLNAAAGEDGALPWGSNEEHDRGFFGDVGAFFVGVGEGFVTMLEDLGGLIGRDPTTGEWSWGTAGNSWLGLGKFVWAVSIYINPVTIVIDQTVGMPFMEKREAGNLLLNAGKSIIAYDTWGEDKSKAAGLATFNIVSAVVGTKGAGSGLRGAGAAMNGIRGSATAARVSAALIRTGNWLDKLPTVGEVAINFAKKFDIKIPQLGLAPAIVGDVPIGRGFEVDMPSTRGGDVMHMDGGNGPGGNLPGGHPTGGHVPGDLTPGGHIPGDSTPGNHTPVGNLPEDNPPVRTRTEDNTTPGNLPEDTPGNLPDDHSPGNVPDDTPGNLPDDHSPGNVPDDTPGNLPDDTPYQPNDQHPIPADRAGPQELGRLEGDLTRDTDGLITHVDGKPLDEHLRDVATQRTDEIRNMRDTGVISAKETGPVNSVAVDLRTGEVFEGVNGRPRDAIPEGNLHPVLRERLDQMRADGPYPQYNRDGTPMMRDGQQVTTPYPHGDNPLRHAEVKAVNEMLWRRGPNVDASVMSEFRVDNRFPFRADGQVPAPCCANCHRLLAGTPSNAGRLTYDSGHPDSQFIPE
ncbi:YwqJ-related putative deaminase [Micromonospora lupini]|uniref:YwqJ-like deaminase n=1 Tax=Micromonospora lupini str. Lupac 08 TaxID=1150864 RepID=I0KVC9_9ACTN|nr:YwqJ-related putative deaminase [Micromonospora lupini]CCH15526.1 Protein of unknown function [Micromonospora lupini str. Lupac 08]